MKRILVLGAGQSSPYLIAHLLKQTELELEVVVADRDPELAARRTAGYPHGRSIGVDAHDTSQLAEAIQNADVVVNLLAPPFQVPIARLCIDAGRSMVSASYRSPGLAELDEPARSRGLVLASEIGMDPGLDHMSAMRLLARIRAGGGRVLRFLSYGSGVVDRSTVNNPLGYAITWNPRNIVMAGESGARFLDRGQLQIVGHRDLFARTWPVHIPGEGTMESYPNRDSIAYIPSYGLEEANTVVRGTLRHPGFCETWSAVARLGLADENTVIPNLSALRWRDLVDVYLPPGRDAGHLRLARHLGLHPTGGAIENLRWLGLFSDTLIGALSEEAKKAETPAQAMVELLKARIPLPPEGRDLVILHHEVEAQYPGNRSALHTSTLVVRGEPSGTTAMAKTVGLPAALAALAILEDRFRPLGAPIPIEPAVYESLLPEVERWGLHFAEDERRSPSA